MIQVFELFHLRAASTTSTRVMYKKRGGCVPTHSDLVKTSLPSLKANHPSSFSYKEIKFLFTDELKIGVPKSL